MTFFSRYKKFFLILIFLAIVFLSAYFIWKFFFQTNLEINPITGVNQETQGFPSVGINDGSTVNEQTGTDNLPSVTPVNPEVAPGSGAINNNQPSDIAIGGLTKTDIINDTPSLSPTLNKSGQVQYYDKNEGKFYKISSDGEKISLSDKIFHSVKNLTWAPGSDKAILEYPDGSKILYNFETQKQVTLPSHWEDFSFSPDSNQLVSKSIGIDPNNRWLVVSNDDGSKASALEEIGTQDKSVYPSWSPNNQIVAMYTEGVDFNRQEVFFVGLNNENFKSTIIEGRGLKSQWSTNGDRLLYSVYNSENNLNPRLWIVNASGDSIGRGRTDLGLETWADKCTFASNTEIYCAVPNNLERGSGLYPQLADKTEDSLYKIDLVTGSQKLIAVPNGSYNISQIMVPEGQDYLYFTDKFSGAIYKVKLR